MTRKVSLAILTALACAPLTHAQATPSGLIVETVADLGTAYPTDIAFVPGRRVFVASKPGELYLYGGGAVTALGSVPGVVSNYERGLLSVAADPGFTHNGYVYAYFSHQSGFNRLSRFTCSGDLAVPDSANIALDPSSERVVLGSIPDISPLHNGGSVRFGPDGMLYLSVGDDRVACDAQDVNSQRGCLIRLTTALLADSPSQTAADLSVLDPGDNPMSGDFNFARLVIAHGMRNPFRMEIDPFQGDIFIGDVGDDLEEEISCYEFSRGAMQLENFGWPWKEGFAVGPGTCPGAAPTGLKDPIAVEPNGTADSIIVGALYRNRGGTFDFGAAYEGSLFYTDWFQGHGRRLTRSASQGWTTAAPVPGQPSATNWAQGLPYVPGWRQGSDGALWFAQRPYWAYPTARIARIRPTGQLTNSISPIAGADQVTNAATDFPQPIVLEVRDSAGAPLQGVRVGVEVLGPAERVGQPVLRTDANGRVTTTIRALDKGGAVRVLATTPGDPNGAIVELYSRRLNVTQTPSSISLHIDNTTSATPPNVNYFVSVAIGPSSPLPTPFGTLCVNPYAPLSIVIEDATGLFNFVSFSGLGSVGDPTLTRSYPFPASLLASVTMRFEAVGFDSVGGWFHTNCEIVQF